MHVNYQECPRGQMNQGARDKSWSMKMFVLEIQLKLEEKKKNTRRRKNKKIRKLMCMHVLVFHI